MIDFSDGMLAEFDRSNWNCFFRLQLMQLTDAHLEQWIITFPLSFGKAAAQELLRRETL